MRNSDVSKVTFPKQSARKLTKWERVCVKRQGNHVKIFSGSSNPQLAQEVCELLGLELGSAKLSRFQSGETYVSIEESVRGADVYVIQSFSHPVNEHFVEL